MTAKAEEIGKRDVDRLLPGLVRHIAMGRLHCCWIYVIIFPSFAQ